MNYAKVVITVIGAIAGVVSAQTLLPAKYQPIAQAIVTLCASLGALFVAPPHQDVPPTPTVKDDNANR